MNFKHLYITYVNPQDPLDTFTLKYKLREHTVVDKWSTQLVAAQEKYSIDDPDRFYGFGAVEQQIADAINRINSCIKTINDFDPIITRTLTDINDQDTLNYLHHIFEVYHGALDNQTHELWQRAPKSVQKALADLNISVHRCESTQRQALPRHVVTYYGLPKTETLDQADYALFEDRNTFGTVYLNYVEIGKTLEDLTIDNDQYIFDTGFQPFRHYSADFVVRFWNDTDRQINEKCAKIKQYYNTHSEFFKQKDLPWKHPYLTSGNIPLADLQYPGSHEELLIKLESHQRVREVILF